MTGMIEQTVMWVLTLGALVLYVQRRRKRRVD